jgi:hypothetical protein
LIRGSLIDNTLSIVARDPAFAKVWLNEKRQFLEVLREIDAVPWRRVRDLSAEQPHELLPVQTSAISHPKFLVLLPGARQQPDANVICRPAQRPDFQPGEWT